MWETFLPVASFVFVGTITPGPNNLMLAASGRQFGYFRTLPHLAGIVLGFTSLMVLCAFGLGSAVTASPVLSMALRIFASGYLLYLLGQILLINSAQDNKDGEPLQLVQAALFQFANPKAWMLAVTGVALVSTDGDSLVRSVFLLCFAFITVGVACNHVWLLSGISAKYFLATRSGAMVFNTAIALLTLYAVASIWSE